MITTLKLLMLIVAFGCGAFLSLDDSWADEGRLPVAAQSIGDLSATPELAEYRGKVILLDFWASWCASCRIAMPYLSELQARYGADGFVVLGVNVDTDRAAADEVMQEAAPNFPVIFDPAGAMPTRFKVKSMPSSFLIDRNGAVVKSHSGFRKSDQKEIELGIEKLLRANNDSGI